MSRDDSDTDDILALYLYNKRRRRRRLRRLSVHEIFQRRNTFGEYHHLVQELSFHPDKFSQYFRMTEEQFDYVLDLIKDDISKQDTNWIKAISPRERLAIGLRFLATGDSYKTISFSFRVGVATVSVIVREVCEAIWNRLQPLHLPAPTKEQRQAIEAGFREHWQFPNCLGALDGKHVMIQAPASSGSTYFNYKKTFSIILLALIDHGYRFAVIDIGSYGSNSDAGIFRKSKLFKEMQNGTLDIPEDKILTVNSDQPCPHVIVGDEAFPLMKNLMRPYPGKDLDYAKRIYNYRLSRARRISENGFGILANRWRIYHRKFPLSPDNVDWVIKATVVLHNMLCCVTEVNGTPRLDVDENEDIHDGILRPMRRAGHRPPDDAITVREIFKTYFVSPAGAVTWQNEMCFGHPN